MLLSDEAVAWFFMGEGSASLCICKRNEKTKLNSILGHRIYPQVSLANTDTELFPPLTNWFKNNELIYSFHTRTPKNRRRAMNKIVVSRHTDIEKFIELLMPHLVGNKRKVCELLYKCLKKHYVRRDWPSQLKDRVIRKGSRIVGWRWDETEERRRFLDIVKYKTKIMALNGTDRKTKYPYDYCIKLWGSEYE